MGVTHYYLVQDKSATFDWQKELLSIKNLEKPWKFAYLQESAALRVQGFTCSHKDGEWVLLNGSFLLFPLHSKMVWPTRHAPFGLTKIVRDCHPIHPIESVWMAIWFDLQGCAYWSHRDSQWAVTGIVNMSPLNGIMVWPSYKAAPFLISQR